MDNDVRHFFVFYFDSILLMSFPFELQLLYEDHILCFASSLLSFHWPGSFRNWENIPNDTRNPLTPQTVIELAHSRHTNDVFTCFSRCCISNKFPFLYSYNFVNLVWNCWQANFIHFDNEALRILYFLKLRQILKETVALNSAESHHSTRTWLLQRSESEIVSSRNWYALFFSDILAACCFFL